MATIDKNKPIGGRKPMRTSNFVQSLRKRGYNDLADNLPRLRALFKELGVKEYQLHGHATIDHSEANRVLACLNESDNLFHEAVQGLATFDPMKTFTKEDAWLILTDQDLVDRLRALGYSVTCKKEINL